MKQSIRTIFTLLLVVFSISGCEKIKELADVKFDANYESTINVDVTPSATKASYGVFLETVTIDPLSNSDMATYAEKLKEIDVIEASAEVVSISTPIKLITASLSASGNNLPEALWTFTNETIAVGTILTLDNANGQFNNLKKILESKKEFTVTLMGQTDVNEATFALKIKFKTRVTANPLD